MSVPFSQFLFQRHQPPLFARTTAFAEELFEHAALCGTDRLDPVLGRALGEALAQDLRAVTQVRGGGKGGVSVGSGDHVRSPAAFGFRISGKSPSSLCVAPRKSQNVTFVGSRCRTWIAFSRSRSW